MDFQTVLSRFQDDLVLVEEAMQASVASDVKLISTIGLHLFSGGGKRIRPMLLLGSAKLCGYEGPRAVTHGCVVELIHTATLLHDDVVDEADQRRGVPTANATWGNHASVLVGDYLFATSFSLMARDGDVHIMQAMANAVTQLAEGEILQLIATCKLTEDEDEYLDVVKRKTASLIMAACRIGAILGAVDPEKEEALALFGLETGMAFQLVDDALDYMAEEERFGKTVGKDLMEGHVTLPLIYLYRNATAAERKTLSNILLEDDVTRRQIDQVVGMMKDYKAIDYTLQTATRYVAQAKQRLAVFEASSDRKALATIADYIVTRDR
jgi:octaprenyl-diphosphate synthase